MKEKELINLFLDMNNLKEVKRFGEHGCGYYHKVFKESVAEHIYHMILIADKLIEILKLDDLDYKKVIKLILYHDTCEHGMTEDFDAFIAHENPEYKKKKQDAEKKNIAKLSSKHGKFIDEIYNEYEEQKTEEAKFVKAIDKIQCNIHTLQRGLKNYDAPQQAYEAIWAVKPVQNFPRLKPLLKAIQEEFKKYYLENNLIWNDDWFIGHL